MNDIADRAGIRKASLFHHFRSKEALYVDTLADIASELGQLVIEADLGSGEFHARLDRLGRLVIEYLGGHPSAARLAMRELVDGGPFSRGAGRQGIELSLAAVARFLDSGMRAGVITEQDPRHLAVSIIGLHLFHFAAAESTVGLFRQSVFDASAIEARTQAVLDQVRRLCGAPTVAGD